MGSGPLNAVSYAAGKYTAQWFMEWESSAVYPWDYQFLYTLDFTSATGGKVIGNSNVSNYTTEGSIVGSFELIP